RPALVPRWAWAILSSSLQDFSRPRSARNLVERSAAAARRRRRAVRIGRNRGVRCPRGFSASPAVHAKQFSALIIKPRTSTEKLPGIRRAGNRRAMVFDQAIMQGKHYGSRLGGDAYTLRSQSPNHLRQLVIRPNVYLVCKR